MPEISPKAVLIAGTHSGAGKTTVTAILLTALRARGLRVRAFKLGPDFIDPGYHAEITGEPSINLDPWLMGEHGVRRSFGRWSRDADICVIESMGALYDGADGTERGSAAQLAKLLGVPVVVVLDVWGMTRTAGAILDGLRAFDPQVRIAGCVLNRTGSQAHARMVLDALPERLRGLVLGNVPRSAELDIPERHLGLLTVQENPAARAPNWARAGEHIETGRLSAIACGAPVPAPPVAPVREPLARLAIARDRAFCFYYAENLHALRAAGFELVPFAPAEQERLPGNIDAVYLGGGYPESFAEQLAGNTALARQLRDRAAAGLPVYAECGGLLYLARSLTGFDGRKHPMAGVLPIDIAMDPDHLVIRYTESRTTRASVLGPRGTVLRGQEFHQSRVIDADLEPGLFTVTTSTGDSFPAGYRSGNVVASYIHQHFGARPDIAENLLRSALGNRPEQSTSAGCQ
ncbi:cobyrinate a,c-diamide synthase [Sciscionella sediminilitoris]|uniref:cobyrinate a,c-diamide synthase n=1 Tax=Sciscionella sediminilitoris TaxID=1445613 RepID=UPI0004DF3293|nr:cobyrinate a,c-diamide synthase [Sciscionella sp. SE31]